MKVRNPSRLEAFDIGFMVSAGLKSRHSGGLLKLVEATSMAKDMLCNAVVLSPSVLIFFTSSCHK